MKLLVFIMLLSFPVFAATIESGFGDYVEFDTGPLRIISLAPSNTEILFAIGAGERVVGVTNYCNWPEAVNNLPKVGDLTINLEKIVALAPDVVLGCEGMNEQGMHRLRELGINVVKFSIKNFNDIIKAIEKTGRICKEERSAAELCKNMLSRQAVIREDVPKRELRKKVYVEINSSPAYSASDNTFIGDIIRRAGGVNIASDLKQQYPKLSDEFIIAQKPEYAILAYPGSNNPRPGLRLLEKIDGTIIVAVDEDIFSRPGPRVIEAIEHLFGILYH